MRNKKIFYIISIEFFRFQMATLMYLGLDRDRCLDQLCDKYHNRNKNVCENRYFFPQDFFLTVNNIYLIRRKFAKKDASIDAVHNTLP